MRHHRITMVVCCIFNCAIPPNRRSTVSTPRHIIIPTTGELEWPADDGSEAEEAAARPEEEGEGKEDYDDEDYDNGEAEDEEHEEEDEDGAASSDEGEEEGREKEEDVEVEAGVDQPPRTQAAAAVNVAAPRGEVKGLLAEYLASSPQVCVCMCVCVDLGRQTPA